MHSRSLTKLFTTPISKLTWSQIQRLKQLRTNKKNLHFSSNTKSCDTFSLKNENITNLSSEQENLSKDLNKVCANGYSSSTIYNFWNKLTTYDQQQFQVPGQVFAHKAGVEPVLVEGIGWAGQPIVRRTHPIVPEVYGDISDIFTAVEKLPGARVAHEEALSFSQSNGVNKIIPGNAQLQAVNLEGKEGSLKHGQHVKDYLVDSNKTKDGTGIQYPTRSPDAISIMHENIRSGSHKHLPSKEVDSGPDTVKGNSGIKRKTGGKVGVISKKGKHIKKMKNMDMSKELYSTKQKKKSKKRTKVHISNSNVSPAPVITKTKIKKGKKNIVSGFGINKKKYAHPNILLSQQMSAHRIRKSVSISANRQIQTYAQANQAKVSIKIKERTSATIVSLAKKKVQGSKLVSEGKYPEDCKCPETLEIKTRFPTKICGEAAGAQEKKKKMKEWKGKMCPVEHKSNYRRRTFVCSSAKFGKAKRKRQLPKCVKPEKKIAPRVVVCPPVLEDEILKQQKKCVKQVEEVKVRSRTKVCKPIIMYQKEETKVVIQKSVCTEKKVKKTISRHTKVCPPSEKNGNQLKSKR